MKIQHRKRLTAWIGAVCMLFSFVATAFAATTISDSDNPYDYFEYHNSSGWHDLNTPYHTDNSTGNWAYCIQHEKDPPSSGTQYTEVEPSAVFSGSTVKGIQAILDHGYPSSSGGLSMAKAHYATANAIRAWIRESAGQGYNFMLVSNGNIRAKSGAEDVWAFFMELLGHARSGNTLGGGSAGRITVNPQNPVWSVQSGMLIAQISVQSTSGYTMSSSSNQINISGYTGGTSDMLTITAPLSIMGTDVSIYFQTPSSGGGVTLYWFEPNSSSKQAVVVTEVTPNTPGDSTSVTISGEFYDLVVNKRDGYTGSALDGATFQLLYNGSPVGLLQTGAGQYTIGGSSGTFTTSGGSAYISMLPAGSYTVVEVSAPSTGYVAAAAQGVQLSGNRSITIDNTPTRMEVLKKNALTGAAMPNLTFSLLDGSNNPVPVTKHADGTYRPASSGSNTFTLDSAGKAVFLYFPNGTYKFKEQSLPGYAELSGNTLTLSGTASITLENDPLTLVLTKVDSFTGAVMPGISFTLADSAGNPVLLKKAADGVYHYDTGGASTFETGSNGKATIHYIPAGNYTLKESGAGSGYATRADASIGISIKNGSKNAAAVRFENDPITLQFTKTDAVTKLALDGGTFRLKDESANTVKLRQIEAGSYRPDSSGSDTFTTKGGTAMIRYLSPATYTIEEVTPPDGYKPDEIKTVTVTDRNSVSNPAKASMEDEPLAIEFTKADEMTGKVMDGAQFSLKDAAGSIVKLKKMREGVYMPDSSGADTFTTSGGKGMIAPIKPGTYTITEVQPAAGYASAADVTVTVTNANVSSNPAKATMADAPLALEITKLDGETKTPIGGATFKLMDGDAVLKLSPLPGKPGWYAPDSSGSETFTIPETGVVTIVRIAKGDWKLVEVDAPAGYVISASSTDVSIDENHIYTAPQQATVENAPLIVELLKLDKNRNAPIPGVLFRVLNSEGETVLFAEDGDGVYTVNAQGEPLIQTGAEGTARLRLLPIGEYELVEAGNPGYKAAAPVPFTVTAENTQDRPVSLTVENEPLYFRLEKVDAYSKRPLGNVPFKMTDSSGNPLYFAKQEDGSYDVTTAEKGQDTFHTDENGVAMIGYIPIGNYTLHEQPYDGYGVLPPEKVIVLDENTKDTPAAAKLENIPLAMEIIKKDSYSKLPLQGVQFKLFKAGEHVRVALMSDGTYRPAAAVANTTGGANEETENNEQAADGAAQSPKIATPTSVETVDTLTTDENGKIRVEYLNTTEYTLEELPFDGYAPLKGLGFTMQSEHTMDAPLVYEIANVPTRLVIEKQHATTREPLTGAKISISYKGSSTKIALVKQEDGSYRPARSNEKGETIIPLDENAQAVICYLVAGEVTIYEEEAPIGYAIAAPITTEVGTENVMQTAIDANSKDAAAKLIAETSIAMLDSPLALRISKIHAKTGKPLKGAAFQLKIAGVVAHFTVKDGIYFYDAKGSVTTIELDGNAEALLHNIPLGQVTIEETVVPQGYFAAVPVTTEVKIEHTSENPLEIIVPNSPTVKLGFGSDQYNILFAVGLTLLAGGAFLFMGLRRRRQKS